MRTATQTKTLTISLPLKFYNGLEIMAAEHDRSKNYLIKKAVENYLENLYFSQKAEKVLAQNEETFSLEEVMKKHGLSKKNDPQNQTRKISRKKSR